MADPAPEASDPAPPRLSARSGYSLFVGTMKVVLPALAVGILLLVLVWPSLMPEDTRFRIGLSDLAPEGGGELSMVNPRFQGRDSAGRPYSVVAETATQPSGKAERVELVGPKADITLADGAWVMLGARAGTYYRERDMVTLRGNVSLFHDRGFEVHTDRARLDLAAGEAVSNSPVSGHGPAGQLEAEGFRLYDGGRRIVLLGRSRLRVYAQTLEGGGT